MLYPLAPLVLNSISGSNSYYRGSRVQKTRLWAPFLFVTLRERRLRVFRGNWTARAMWACERVRRVPRHLLDYEWMRNNIAWWPSGSFPVEAQIDKTVICDSILEDISFWAICLEVWHYTYNHFTFSFVDSGSTLSPRVDLRTRYSGSKPWTWDGHSHKPDEHGPNRLSAYCLQHLRAAQYLQAD